MGENPKTKFVERITIEERFVEKLACLVKQANEYFQGMSRVSKSDVLNYLLMQHLSAFTDEELNDLRKQHFNEVKFSQWITAQLKSAQARGETLNLKDLLERNLSFVGSKSKPVRQKRAYQGKAKRTAKVDEVTGVKNET